MSVIDIFVDGSCLQNPGGVGAWAAILESGSHRREIAGGLTETTNNQAELMAAIKGVSLIKRGDPAKAINVNVFSDSQYVVYGARERAKRWRSQGWHTNSGGHVANEGMWKDLLSLTERKDLLIQWEWVRGHSGHPQNEDCHYLAEQAANAANCGRVVELDRRGYSLAALCEMGNRHVQRGREEREVQNWFMGSIRNDTEADCEHDFKWEEEEIDLGGAAYRVEVCLKCGHVRLCVDWSSLYEALKGK